MNSYYIHLSTDTPCLPELESRPFFVEKKGVSCTFWWFTARASFCPFLPDCWDCWVLLTREAWTLCVGGDLFVVGSTQQSQQSGKNGQKGNHQNVDEPHRTRFPIFSTKKALILTQQGKEYLYSDVCSKNSWKLSGLYLSLIHIWRCRRSTLCRSRWSPYH